MNKKVPTELAIGIIFFVVISFGFLIWKYNSDCLIKNQNTTFKSVEPVTNNQQANLNNSNLESEKNSITQNISLNKTKLKNGCNFAKYYENEGWFKEMVDLHEKTLPRNQDYGKFYLDDSSLGQKLTCLYSNYFVFVPYENLDMGGILYSYDINSKTLVEAPSKEKYYSDHLIEINDNYASFIGSEGSGDCSYEDYGRYYYKENKVEIYKTCSQCVGSPKKCTKANVTYK